MDPASLYTTVAPHLTPDLRYTPDVNEAEDGFAVWDTESGEQYCLTDGLEEAISLARQMNEGVIVAIHHGL